MLRNYMHIIIRMYLIADTDRLIFSTVRRAVSIQRLIFSSHGMGLEWKMDDKTIIRLH